MADFLIGLANASLRRRNPYLAHDLGWLERGGQHIHKEIIGVDDSLSARTGNNHVRTEGNDRRWPVTRRVGMGNAATNRPLISHLHIANVDSTIRQQGTDFL